MKKLLDYTVRRRTKDCAKGEDCCKGGTHSYYTIQMGRFYDHIYSEDEVILMLARIRDQKERDKKRDRLKAFRHRLICHVKSLL